MADFTACDLCFRSLGARLVDIQIAPGTLVQISDEGGVVHRSRGLRDYRLCERCGGYLLDIMRVMTAHTRRASPREDETAA